MKNKIALSLGIAAGFFLASDQSIAQLPDGKFLTTGTVSGADTIPSVNLPPLKVQAMAGIPSSEKRAEYYKLKYNIRITLPYAKKAAEKLKEVNEKSLTLKNNRQRHKYLKSEEKVVKGQFEEEVKNLTVTQGRILIKLINRETGSTTYALVKELKGSLNAFIWQGVAHLWGSNLKTEYNPDGEDRMMEQIIYELEQEQLQTRK